MSIQVTATKPVKGWLAGTLALDLKTVPPSTASRLKRELSLYQRGFNGDGQLVEFALEYDGWLHIPRGYALGDGAWLLSSVQIEDQRTAGHALPKGTRVGVEFGVPPYPPSQPQAIADAVANAKRNSHGGLFLAPTRSGKTLCSIEVACRLGGSTLILVDRKPLLDQWKEAVEKHVIDEDGRPVRCGVIREDRFEVPPDYPFTVATIQTLVRRKLTPEERGAWRTVIVDECQSSPCILTWSALRRIATRYVFGLSATPDRADGLAPAIPWVIGPQVAKLHREMHADVHFLQVAYADAPVPKRAGSKNHRSAKLTKPTGAVDIVEAEKALLRDPARVALIADEAAKAVRHGRQVLILVGLRDHASKLLDACRVRGLTPGLYIGGNASTAEMEKNPVVATYGIAAKGIDFQPPPTLAILAGPRSDVRQAIGRVLQPQAPHTPMILDVVDGARPLIGQAHRRQRFYKEQQFNIRNEVWS